MKCKKHPTDLSSSVGVCASCLRERLVAIIAAQAQALAALKQAQQDCMKSDTQPPLPPPPLSYHRPASPYIPRRKSDINTWQPHDQLRFFSTPQLGPNGSITMEIKNKEKTNKGARFSSLFLGLFRSKSESKPDPEFGPISDPRVFTDSCSASPSWFSNIIPGRKKKKIRAFSVDERTHRNRGRGMSPASHTDKEDEHCQPSGYSSDSQGWRPTRASVRRGHSRSVSGLAFCVNPLVRPSPNHHWIRKGIPPEMLTPSPQRRDLTFDRPG